MIEGTEWTMYRDISEVSEAIREIAFLLAIAAAVHIKLNVWHSLGNL
ncbi:hypothetical protein CBM2637_A200169 [Cupriavidus taiwanensis]|nr:hypothetical protein CBM2637_A200169 [Cupriavidus taiwanensis]